MKGGQLTNERDVAIIKDQHGNNIVMITDIIFKGKRTIDWKGVKEYLRKFVGNNYKIISTNEKIYIGNDLPNEYIGSTYTNQLRGMKANAAQGIPELIEIATGKHYKENEKEKHSRDAKYGWYRYDARFAMPIYENDEIKKFNIYHTSLIVRHCEDGKKYLYDLLDVKKETSNPLKP